MLILYSTLLILYKYNADIVQYNVDIIQYIADIVQYNDDIAQYNADIVQYNVDIIQYIADIVQYNDDIAVICFILFENGLVENSPYSEQVDLLAKRLRFDWQQEQVPPRPLFASYPEDILTKPVGASGPTGLQII
jgi:hypothetical protein